MLPNETVELRLDYERGLWKLGSIFICTDNVLEQAVDIDGSVWKRVSFRWYYEDPALLEVDMPADGITMRAYTHEAFSQLKLRWP